MDVEAPRSLRDLNKLREPVQFLDPDTGQTHRVWVAKLNSDQTASIERVAGAKKAIVLLDRDDPESDLFLAHLSELLVLDDPNLVIPFIVSEQVQEFRLSAIARHASEGKWGKDDLHGTLVDAWKGNGEDPNSLESIWAAYPEEPEESPENPNLVPLWRDAQRVHEQLSQFIAEVDQIVEEEIPDIEAPYRVEPDEHGEYNPDDRTRLFTKAVRVFIEAAATEAYWAEFTRQRAYYATRKRFTQPDPETGIEVAGPEARERYFETLADYDDCDDSIKETIRVAYDKMSLGALEGKELLAATPSSSPPGSPEQEESETSGQQVAPA